MRPRRHRRERGEEKISKNVSAFNPEIKEGKEAVVEQQGERLLQG